MSAANRHSSTELLEIFPVERVLQRSNFGGRTYRCGTPIRPLAGDGHGVRGGTTKHQTYNAISAEAIGEKIQALSILQDDEFEDEVDSEGSSPIPLHMALASKNLSSRSRKKLLIEDNPLGEEQSLVELGFTPERHFSWEDQPVIMKSPIERVLQYFIENHIQADCKVCIGDDVIYNCHRIALQCYSGYFDSHPLDDIVVLPEDKVSQAAFEGVYSWMLAEVDSAYYVIQRSNILEMLMAARYLQITDLEVQIVDVINDESLFSETVAYVLYTKAKSFGLPDIQEVMLPRIQSFFLTLVSTKDFLELEESTVCAILSSNEIMVHNEMEVFMSGTRWLKYMWPLRQESIYKVMETVRFGLIPAVALVAIRRNHHSPEFVDILSSCPEVNRLLDDGVAYNVNKHVYGSEGGFEVNLEREGLAKPDERNWILPNKNCENYKDFLQELENLRERIVKTSPAPRRRMVRGNPVGGRIKLIPACPDPGDGDNGTNKRNQPMQDEFSFFQLGCAVPSDIEWDQIRNLSPKPDLYTSIKNRLSDYINTDCTVITEDAIKYNTHRILLNAYSRFFNASSLVDDIQLPDTEVTSGAFKTIYKWMLSDAEVAQQVLRRDSLLEVYMAARYLQISELEALCYSMVQNKFFFAEGSAYVLYIIAKGLKFRDIMDLMIPRVSNFFVTMVCSKDFLELDVDDICAFLSSNSIVVNSELEVFFSAVRWLRSKWVQKKSHVYNVMSCVRFGYIPAMQLVEIKCNEDLRDIISEVDVTKLIDTGLAYSVIKSKYAHDKERYAKTLAENFIVEPVPRNWSEAGAQSIQTYSEFLQYLQQRRKEFINEKFEERMYSAKEENATKERRHASPEIDALSRKSSRNIRDWHAPNVRVGNREMRNLTSDSYPKPCHPMLADGDEDDGAGDQFQTHRDIYKRAKQHENSSGRKESRVKGKNVKANAAARTTTSRVITSAFKEHVRNNPSFAESNSGSRRDYFICNAQKGGATKPIMSNEGESILVFGGIDPSELGPGEKEGKQILRYCEDEPKWELIGEMPEPRYYHAAILSGDRIYIIGGTDVSRKDDRNRSPVVDTVWSMDIKTGNWYKEAKLPTPRRHVGVAENLGNIYVIGGLDSDGNVLDTVERYNPKSRKWEVGPPLNVARYAHCTAFFKNSIWVVGGRRAEEGDSDSVERLPLTGFKWEIMPPLRYERSYAALIAMEKSLYLSGGAQLNRENNTVRSILDVDEYDGQHNWNRRFALSTPRHLHAVCALGSRIIGIGGTSTAFAKSPIDVEDYCCKRKTKLRSIRPLPRPILGHQAVTIPRGL